MNKLTYLEAQRVMNVLTETLDRLEYLSYIPVESDESLLQVLNENNYTQVSTCLRLYWQLENETWNHSKENAKVHQLPFTTPQSATKPMTHPTLRNLCRELVNCPQVLKYFQTYRSEEIVKFNQVFSNLTSLTFEKLQSTVEEDQARKTLLKELSQKKNKAKEEYHVLESKLKMERNEKNDKLARLGTQVQKLRNELHDNNQNSFYELGIIEAEMKDLTEKAYDEHLSEMKSLQDKTLKLQELAATQKETNRLEEAALRKKKSKLETEVLSWIDKYDTEMQEKTQILQTIHKDYAKEMEQYHLLREYFQKIDAEQARIDAENEIHASILAKEDQAKKLLANSATQIQKRIRGFLVRKALRKQQSKKKKGKKNKKKKNK